MCALLLFIVLLALLPPLITVNRYQHRIASSIGASPGKAGASGQRDADAAADAGIYAGQLCGGRGPGVRQRAGDPVEFRPCDACG